VYSGWITGGLDVRGIGGAERCPQRGRIRGGPEPRQSAGDDGFSDQVQSGAHVDFPASSPFVLGVGGTKLMASGDGVDATIAEEVLLAFFLLWPSPKKGHYQIRGRFDWLVSLCYLQEFPLLECLPLCPARNRNEKPDGHQVPGSRFS